MKKIQINGIEGFSESINVELPDDALLLQMENEDGRWENLAFAMGNSEKHYQSIDRLHKTIKLYRTGYNFRVIQVNKL